MKDLMRMVVNDPEEVKWLFMRLVGGTQGFNYPEDSMREIARLLHELSERVKALEAMK